MKRLFLIGFCVFVIQCIGYSQYVALDDVTLHTQTGRISKISLAENENNIAIAWLAGVREVAYFQVFTKNGAPVSDTIRLTNGRARFGMDVDIIFDKDGKVIVASSDTLPTGSYTINYQKFLVTGEPINTRQQVVTNGYPYMKLAINPDGKMLIGWTGGGDHGFQFLNADATKDGEPFYVQRGLESTQPDLHSSICAITDDGKVRLSWLENQQGLKTAIVGETYIGGLFTSTLKSFNADVNGDITAIISGNWNPQWSELPGTYVSLTNTPGIRYEGDSPNLFQLDEIKSKRAFIDIEETGFMAAWHTVNNEVKINYHLRTGEPAGLPATIEGGDHISSMDIHLEGPVGTIVYAETIDASLTGIRLQRFHFNPRKYFHEMALVKPEELDEPVNQYNSVFKSITNGRDRSVLFWVEDVLSNAKPAIVGQLLDKNYQPIGEPIEMFSSSSYTHFDAAMDSAGNFMITYYENGNIHAQMFSKDGTVLVNKTMVNELEGNTGSPRIDANDKGAFIITWFSGNFDTSQNMRARMYSNDVWSSEKGISGFDGSRPVISMNDEGQFVVATRSGYYNVICKVFDNNLNLVGSFTRSNVLDTNGYHDVAITNGGNVILATSHYSGTNIIRVRGFNSSGTTVIPETAIRGVDILRGVQLDVDSAGGFAVAYQKPGHSITVQRFDKNGIAIAEPVRASIFSSVYLGAMSLMENSDVLVAWKRGALGIVVKILYGNKCVIEENSISAEIEEGTAYEFYAQQLTKAGKYAHVIWAEGKCDEVEILTLNIIPDTHPPVAPKDVLLTSTEYDITLSWTENTEEDLKEYRVYRQTGTDEFILVGSFTGASFTDHSAADGVTYNYHVYAADKANNLSDPSAVSGSRHNLKPSAPANLAIIPGSKPHLAWDNSPETDVVAYRVYRNSWDDNSTAELVSEADGKTYVDDAPAPGTMFYWVTSVDQGDLESDFSNKVSFLLTGLEIDKHVVVAYPNPTQGEVYLDDETLNASLRLLDFRGKEVRLTKGVIPNSISLVDLPAGIYILEVTSNNSKAFVRLVLTR